MEEHSTTLKRKKQDSSSTPKDYVIIETTNTKIYDKSDKKRINL